MTYKEKDSTQDKPNPIEEIHQLVGEASRCWDKEGVFETDHALKIATRLCDMLKQAERDGREDRKKGNFHAVAKEAVSDYGGNDAETHQRCYKACIYVLSRTFISEKEAYAKGLKDGREQGFKHPMSKEAREMEKESYNEGLKAGMENTLRTFEKRLPFSMNRTCDCSADAVYIIKAIRQAKGEA